MVSYVLLAVGAAVIVAGVGAPFIIGFIRGPQAGQARPGRDRTDRSMLPLSRIAGVYGRFVLLYVIGAAWSASNGFYPGAGPAGSVCVNTGFPADATTHTEAARPGAALRASGDISACALHPSAGQSALYLLTELPKFALWAVVLLLIWRLIAEAGRSGPFTARAATVLRQLGWVVMIGSAVVGALSHLGADLLTRMLMTPATFDVTGTVADVLGSGLKALFPVPVLAGAALLTFGRMTRTAAVMDEELKATV